MTSANDSVVTLLKHLVFTAVAVALFTIGFIHFQQTRAFLEKVIATHGMLVNFERVASPDIDDHDTFAPVIVYKAQRGEDFKFTAGVSSYPPEYEEGDRVELLYSPDDPTRVRINSFWSLWGGIAGMWVMGVAFLYAGIGLPLLKMRRVRRKGAREPSAFAFESDRPDPHGVDGGD